MRKDAEQHTAGQRLQAAQEAYLAVERLLLSANTGASLPPPLVSLQMSALEELLAAYHATTAGR